MHHPPSVHLSDSHIKVSRRSCYIMSACSIWCQGGANDMLNSKEAHLHNSTFCLKKKKAHSKHGSLRELLEFRSHFWDEYEQSARCVLSCLKGFFPPLQIIFSVHKFASNFNDRVQSQHTSTVVKMY